MKNLIHTAVVTLFAASAAHAQEAVQWKVSDGGNGHWYAFNASLTSWHDARSIALGRGGDLASLSSTPEREFWMSRIPIGAGAPGCAGCTWLGGFQDRSAPEYSEPGGGWRWSDGTAWNYTFWNPGEPNDLNGPDYLYGSGPTNGRWDDSSGSCCAASVIEWSADCNSDGIVDYGQCRDGTLPDYNSNNIPDCCEAGAPCPAGRYPVQWRTSDGGNGHWYLFATPTSSSIDWPTAQTWAESKGGYLASLTTVAESTWCRGVVTDSSGWWTPHVNPSQYYGPWIGGYQNRSAPDYSEPSGGWRWISGETWIWPNWMPGQPDDGCGGEDYLHLMTIGGGFPTMEWNDFNGLCGWMPKSLLVEWSADCNNDGIVDYGQILQGQLADNDVDGIPDICEVITCHDSDLNLNGIVDGGDLGVLLAFWGTASPAFPRADINRDGVVNGADLGLLLSFWGACPN
jgi:hypothetical protein